MEGWAGGGPPQCIRSSGKWLLGHLKLSDNEGPSWTLAVWMKWEMSAEQLERANEESQGHR